MITFSAARIAELVAGFSSKRVAVVGDMMLDRYYWGHATRISPEAPVPVVDVMEESNRFGGASNVGYNIKNLGATAVMLGVIGDDMGGRDLLSLLSDNGVRTDGLIVDTDRPTTAKTRIIADHQHVVRIDHEKKHPISEAIEDELLARLASEMPLLDCVILEDYNKGVLTRRVIHESIRMAREQSVPIMVDPKFSHFFEYTGATLFKPNRKEVRDALGSHTLSPEDVTSIGKHLLERLKAENVLITLGDEGMVLFEKGSEPLTIPTLARSAADVSGAGDTVIATLAVAFAAGASMKESAMLANVAAGIVIEIVGVVPITANALVERILADVRTQNVEL